MSLYLYGLIRQPEAVNFGAIGFEGAPVRAIPCGPFAAVVGPPPTGNLTGISKEELVKRLLAHQQTLESVMKHFFVLPFKFGTLLKDESELGRILEESSPLFEWAIQRMQACVEIDVIANWDLKAILREISEEDPEIIVCKKKIEQDAGATDADRAFVGKQLARSLKQRAESWSLKILKSLEGSALACAPHELLNDEMVLNTSFLIHRDQEKDFFRVLEGTDQLFEKKLHFKCVGPLPPYSFATITVKRFDPEEVQEAAKLLGLNGSAELDHVKKVYRELSRKTHPDQNPNSPPENFKRLNKAYELMADYCKEGMRSLKNEAIEHYLRLDFPGSERTI